MCVNNYNICKTNPSTGTQRLPPSKFCFAEYSYRPHIQQLWDGTAYVPLPGVFTSYIDIYIYSYIIHTYTCACVAINGSFIVRNQNILKPALRTLAPQTIYASIFQRDRLAIWAAQRRIQSRRFTSTKTTSHCWNRSVKFINSLHPFVSSQN